MKSSLAIVGSEGFRRPTSSLEIRVKKALTDLSPPFSPRVPFGCRGIEVNSDSNTHFGTKCFLDWRCRRRWFASSD
jgi:hypothetical protein